MRSVTALARLLLQGGTVHPAPLAKLSWPAAPLSANSCVKQEGGGGVVIRLGRRSKGEQREKYIMHFVRLPVCVVEQQVMLAATGGTMGAAPRR